MQQPIRSMFRLLRYLDRYRVALWSGIGSSVANKIFDLMPPFLTAWVIDTVSNQTPAWIARLTGWTEPWPVILFITVLTFLIFALESFFEWIYKRGFLRLAQRVQHDLRLEAYRRVQLREIAFFEEQRTGNLMAMLNDDVNQLERFLNSIFNEIIQLFTLLIFAGWSLCAVSLQLGLLGMAPIPFIILGSMYYQRRIAPHYKAVREGVGQLGARLENNLSGIQVIKSFTAEQYEAERVQQESEHYRNANFRAIRLSAVYIPLIRIFISLGFTATLAIGAYWVLFEPGRFTYGALAFFAMMIQRLLWPVTRLGIIFDEYERARASARRVFALLDTPASITNPPNPHRAGPVRGAITLERVEFAYRPVQPILRSINLHIEPGQTIGVAGPTGSGKTTLIKLLLRFYDVDRGSILLDGVDLRQYDLTELRRQIGLVSQDVYLFHGTIRENIAYGMPEAGFPDIMEAARRAQLHEFIAGLPDGYESVIGERGIKLSGGQRQRLSIARALLKDAPILILDEATSAVDTETERAIQENLRQLTAGKTAIIIAHRLSTIRLADHIIVLESGQITESGTHEELLERGGTYASLWWVQTGEAKAGREGIKDS